MKHRQYYTRRYVQTCAMDAKLSANVITYRIYYSYRGNRSLTTSAISGGIESMAITEFFGGKNLLK